jgi:hypothetical protein
MTSRSKNPFGQVWGQLDSMLTEQKDPPPERDKGKVLHDFEEEPFGATPSVLVVSRDSAAGRLLGDTLRRQLNCRVLLASGVAETQYLVAVEGNIRLLLADSLCHEHLGLARWFLATQPAATVLVAEDSLWKLTGGPGRCDQMLMAKSYTREELASTVRPLLTQRKPHSADLLRGLRDAA